MSDITDLLQGKRDDDPRLSSLPPFVQGKVLDIADSKNKGLVKVEYTEWAANKNVVQWIPVMRPYAGKGYGLYVMPEIDDIVIISFMGRDLNRPFIVGSLYPAGNTFVAENWVDKNTKRRLKFKGGVDFTVSEESGKASVTAVTPKGLTIKFEDEKEIITVSDKNGKNILKIDSKNGQIDITAGKKMNFKAGKCTIAMDGTKGSISVAGNKVEIKSKQSGTFDGGQKLDLTGGMLTAQGKQTASFKGGTTAELKGGVVNIG